MSTWGYFCLSHSNIFSARSQAMIRAGRKDWIREISNPTPVPTSRTTYPSCSPVSATIFLRRSKTSTGWGMSNSSTRLLKYWRWDKLIPNPLKRRMVYNQIKLTGQKIKERQQIKKFMTWAKDKLLDFDLPVVPVA